MAREIISGVYVIENTANAKKYIGSSVNVYKRWKDHLRQLTRGDHHSRRLQKAWAEFGEAAFSFRLLLVCSRDNTAFYEQMVLDEYRPEYNILPNAFTRTGYSPSPETRAKHSIAAKRTKNFSGKKHTLESKLKISQSRKGKGLGRRSEEVYLKISERNKGKEVPLDVREKISKALKGRKQDPEIVLKRANSHRASSKLRPKRRLSEEHKLKLSAAKCKLSDETVRSVRTAHQLGINKSVIYILFGVGPSAVEKILSRKTYWWAV